MALVSGMAVKGVRFLSSNRYSSTMDVGMRAKWEISDQMSDSSKVKLERFSRSDTELAFRLAGDGPLIILLHGFPDTAETWEASQAALTKSGYKSAALHLRGYPPSNIPKNGDYSIRALVDDALALIDHLGSERAAIVGHDWGAAAAYATAALYPDRLNRIVALAIPPFPVFQGGLRERIARPHNFYLSFGHFSVWWLRRRSFREVVRLYRNWSPHWAISEGHIARVKAALARPGRARAAVDYYAAKLSVADQRAINRNISVPTLIVYGSDEPKVRHEMFLKAIDVVGEGSSIVRFEDVGHWPHLEAPERFHHSMISFLDEQMAP